MNIKPILRAGLQSGTIMSIADIVTQLVIEGKHINNIPHTTKNTTRKIETNHNNNNYDDDIKEEEKSNYMSSVAPMQNNNNNNNIDDTDLLYYNVNRTIRWTIAGLILHGPYFFIGFSIVDKYFNNNSHHHGGGGNINKNGWKVVLKKTAIAQFVLFPPYLVTLFGLMGLLENHPPHIIVEEKIIHHVPQAFLGGCLYWPIANSINFAFVSSNLRVPYLALSAGIWNSYLSWTNNK